MLIEKEEMGRLNCFLPKSQKRWLEYQAYKLGVREVHVLRQVLDDAMQKGEDSPEIDRGASFQPSKNQVTIEARHVEVHERLEYILENAAQNVKQFIKGNINVFYDYTRILSKDDQAGTDR